MSHLSVASPPCLKSRVVLPREKKEKRREDTEVFACWEQIDDEGYVCFVRPLGGGSRYVGVGQ